MRADDRRALGASFRDPSGFVFESGGTLYRQVNEVYRPHWERLMQSGLYQELAGGGLLIPHEEADRPGGDESAFLVIRPERVPFVSYPYEWTFGQLKAAALLTLDIQRRALAHGMSLKDASAYNVQFIGSRPVLIDTLSFEIYREGEPWVAYRQFCEHFLAPLAVGALTDARLGLLPRLWIDGVPLGLAAKLLPLRSRLSLPLLTHIHLHAGSQARHEDARALPQRHRGFSRLAMDGLVSSLTSAVRSLRCNTPRTTWSDYYETANYSEDAMRSKRDLVADFVRRIGPSTVWDLGANTGVFSEIARDAGAFVVAMDGDVGAVEAAWRRCAETGEEAILPLVVNFANPSPAIGWNLRERESLIDRGPADMALALALVHHLAIGNNVPFAELARFLARICAALVIEFVPRSDPQVQRMLSTREDVFGRYDPDSFTAAFAREFEILDTAPIESSQRTLYLMQRKAHA